MLRETSWSGKSGTHKPQRQYTEVTGEDFETGIRQQEKKKTGNTGGYM